MMRKVLLSKLTASGVAPSFLRRSGSSVQYCVWSNGLVSSESRQRLSELPRVDSLVDGCDYKHWLVMMHPPDNYPQREEIIQQYIRTLGMALGSEKAAMESIYSVSTKYYFAFGCKVTQQVTDKIKLLPRVKWVLPDSYLSPKESGYGGEPYVNGNVVPYEERYHADWSNSDCYDNDTERSPSRRPRRKRRGARNFP